MWRPKGWKTLFDCSICDTEPEGCPGCGSNAFEAGADAMLERLLQTGYEIEAGETFGDEATGARTIVKVDGKVVFIPEDEE